MVVAARICEERTDGGGQAHHSSDVRPAEEHPVVGRPDGDVGTVGEPVDDDRDHREAEAEDEDEQVLRARGSASVGGEVARASARARGAGASAWRACMAIARLLERDDLPVAQRLREHRERVPHRRRDAVVVHRDALLRPDLGDLIKPRHAACARERGWARRMANLLGAGTRRAGRRGGG